MKYLLILFLVLSFQASADEIESKPEMLYMPNSAGGFLVLTDNPCPIEGVNKEYPYAAYETDDLENKIDGCWVRPNAPEPFEPFVNVYMNEWGSINIGIFKQRLFTPIKKRLPEVEEEKPQPKATL